MGDPRIAWRRGVVPSASVASGRPDDSWTKAEITDWLDANDIEYTSRDTKEELLSLAAAHGES